ncbi:hypothetical protein K438DRAFT_1972766 [Mycena galopus ATCC 62051]|nr:hypothetical protein K438DRAFT_1972766 [Mycena galopus ATCC 62051]
MLHGSADTVRWEECSDNETQHMDSVCRDPSQIGPWTAAIHDRFFGKGKLYGRAEWDSLLGASQLPSILFAEDLIDAYPEEKKVILTSRDPDAWYISYDSTIGSILRSRTSYIAGALYPGFLGKFFLFARACPGALLGNGDTLKDMAKARFAAHQDREWRVGEGWPRLCKSLADDVPAEDYPNTNDTRECTIP